MVKYRQVSLGAAQGSGMVQEDANTTTHRAPLPTMPFALMPTLTMPLRIVTKIK